MLKNKHLQSTYPFIVLPIFIWIGFICSISFMEAWVKFQAKNLSLPVGLTVGKIVFSALNRAEWLLATLTLALFYLKKSNFWTKNSLLLLAALLVLVVQTFFLLPELNKRAEAICQGITLSRSFLHFYYIFLEITKTALLFILGIKILKQATKKLKK